MKNPWLEISQFDYENHMTEVGQAQCLNALTQYCLDKYLPKTFALLGCATGNGLEHINPKITKKVYAIDINLNYLHKTKEKFQSKISNLEILNTDIQNAHLEINNVDLFFVGLVLEYVKPEKALQVIIKTLSKKGVLFIVVQKSKQTSFVSKTKYKSLEKLERISNEVNEREIDKLMGAYNMGLIKRQDIKLTDLKSFIILEYRLK